MRLVIASDPIPQFLVVEIAVGGMNVRFAFAVGFGVEGPSVGGGGVMDDGDEAVVELLLFFGLWAVFAVQCQREF